MLLNLWARITKADQRKQYPAQQYSSLRRLGDAVVVFPYGLYADLPNETLMKMIASDAMIPVTEKRPGDTETGEPVIFHPKTNSRIVFRNNGDIDILLDESKGNINVKAKDVNLEMTGNLNATIEGVAELNVTGQITAESAAAINLVAPEITADGNFTVTGSTTLGATVTSSGKDISNTHTHAGPVTAPSGPIAPTGAPV